MYTLNVIIKQSLHIIVFKILLKLNLKKDSGYLKGKLLIIVQPLMDKYIQTVRVKAQLAMDATLLRDLS